MKNLFLSMLAVAGMLMATSCSKEDAVSESSDFVNATFTIGAENGIGTRTDVVGKGLSANTVACAVFDANGEEMAALRQYVPVNGKQATYNVRLAKGQNYRVAFFAYNGNDDGTSAYYDVTNMKSIKILPNQASNIEARDAFTKYIDIAAADLTNKSNLEEIVSLKRPFAQLNLGIDQTEYNDAMNAGVIVTNSQITVHNVYDAFNAFEDDIANDANVGSMTFAMNAIPTESLKIGTDEYHYLALNYLLVGDMGQEKALADVDFKWQTANGKTNEPTTHFLNIPVQRNYRTNIIGKLLTTPADFTIKIDAEFENKDGYVEEVETVITKTVNNAAELKAAINNATEGQNLIKFGANIGGDITITQKPDVEILIDGQNYQFTGTIFVEGGSQWGNTEGLSIKNVDFKYMYTVAGEETDIIQLGKSDDTSTRYVHNVIISDCKFSTFGVGIGNGGYNIVPIRAYQANDIKVANCTFGNGMHSAAQITGGHNIFFEKVTSNCLRGISLGSATGCLVSLCDITAAGDGKYGIRHNADSANDVLKIVNTKVNAFIPVVVRKTNSDPITSYKLVFDGINTLTKGGDYHVAVANQEYDAVGKTLTALANATVTGEDASWSVFK